MEQFISMFIDNELSLEEKIIFLQQIRENEGYARCAETLLTQEKVLQSALKRQIPSHLPPVIKRKRYYRTFGMALAACLLIAFSFMIGAQGFRKETALHPESASISHRFVIYSRGSHSVEIAGSFTDWRRIPLSPSGVGDYWEVTLPLTRGEHRYSFIIDAKTLIPDPTVASRESDDFGAVNSVLRVGTWL